MYKNGSNDSRILQSCDQFEQLLVQINRSSFTVSFILHGHASLYSFFIVEYARTKLVDNPQAEDRMNI